MPIGADDAAAGRSMPWSCGVCHWKLSIALVAPLMRGKAGDTATFCATAITLRDVLSVESKVVPLWNNLARILR